jgi:hypothetical protein
MKELCSSGGALSRGQAGVDGSGISSGAGLENLCATYPTFFDSLNRLFRIYYSSPLRRFPMADAPRITVEELKRRMDAGEDFTVIDVRNPQAWAESDTMLPKAIRVPIDKLEENLPRIPKNRPSFTSSAL